MFIIKLKKKIYIKNYFERFIYADEAETDQILELRRKIKLYQKNVFANMERTN